MCNRSLVRFTLVAIFAFASAVSAQEKKADDSKIQIDKPTQKAIDKGLEWLAGKQNTDGSWGDSRYPHNTAITSFALLAFMSQGNVPNQGKYGPEVSKGARFLITSARKEDGYIVGSRGGNMYCHGMATLALAELWGMTGDEEIKPVLKKAVELIIKCQHPDNGGWRYSPTPIDADISVTIMQVMALRAAKNGGIHVPKETIEKAIGYIEKCYNADRGGFTYQPRSSSVGFARTAAGVCVLHLTGKYDDKKIPKAVEYLMEKFERPGEHYWYGQYYACHALNQVGGKEWVTYYTTMKKTLLASQEASGEWSRPSDGGSPGTIFQTAVAVQLLSVPSHYLPIFQR